MSDTTSDRWTHGEYTDDVLQIPFDFFWCRVDSLPALVANYDDRTSELKTSLGKLSA